MLHHQSSSSLLANDTLTFDLSTTQQQHMRAEFGDSIEKKHLEAQMCRLHA